LTARDELDRVKFDVYRLGKINRAAPFWSLDLQGVRHVESSRTRPLVGTMFERIER
jgi:hypothetical protein